MKPIVSAVAAVLLFSGTGFVAAQTVVIQPEQETVVREYIKKKPIDHSAWSRVEHRFDS